MKELPVIEATYNKLAEILDREVEQAEQSRDSQAAARARKRQKINDSAYFLLVWGQLEARINEMAEAAARKRQADERWEFRRAWDSFNPSDMRRTKFEDRLALVLDRAAGKGSAFPRAMRLYAERNRIAHGVSLAEDIDVPFVIAEAYRFESEMRD